MTPHQTGPDHSGTADALELIVALSDHGEGCDSQRALSLLYLADRRATTAQAPICDEPYHLMPTGPAPASIAQITTDMVRNGRMKTSHANGVGQVRSKFYTTKRIDCSSLSEIQKEAIVAATHACADMDDEKVTLSTAELPEVRDGKLYQPIEKTYQITRYMQTVGKGMRVQIPQHNTELASAAELVNVS